MRARGDGCALLVIPSIIQLAITNIILDVQNMHHHIPLVVDSRWAQGVEDNTQFENDLGALMRIYDAETRDELIAALLSENRLLNITLSKMKKDQHEH